MKKSEFDYKYQEIKDSIKPLLADFKEFEKQHEIESDRRLTEIVVSAMYDLMSIGITKEEAVAKVDDWLVGKFD